MRKTDKTPWYTPGRQLPPGRSGTYCSNNLVPIIKHSNTL